MSAAETHRPVTPTGAAAAAEGVLELPSPWPLERGGTLEAARLAWRLVGPAAAPVVLAIGGISARRRVTAEDGGWWAALVGAGRALDARRFRILGIDYLGGSGDSTGPARGAAHFPTLSSQDQARAVVALLDHLGLARLHAVVGASYGGMVALALGERHAARVGRLVVISAADRAHPLSAAWRSIEREIVRFGISRGDPGGGLKLARALAMTTYRTPREFAERFGGAPRMEGGRWRLPVEDYVLARGDAYVAVHVPEAFVCLSESIDLHSVDATRIAVPTLAIGVREDQLVPLADVEALVARLPAGRLGVLDSLYGHDAFLKEERLFRPLLADFLEGPAP
jgi:homoserine O-acetyltransferase